MSVKYRAHNGDFSEMLWPEKHSATTLKGIRQNYIDMGMPDVYSQEYLNIPLDESVAYFKRHDFDEIDERDRDSRLQYYITVDLAIAEHERADYSVFLVAGVDENKKIHVRNVIRERMDAREIVTTLIELQRSYNPLAIGIEDMQVTKSIGPFLYEEMFAQNTFINVIRLKHGGKDKIARARSIQARLRAKSVKFDKEAGWYQVFEDELTRFPRDTHDDQVDAFAYLGLMLNMLTEASTVAETEEEEYQEELITSGLNLNGRNRVCGY